MVAVPAATAVITPVAETVAIAGALVPYVIVAAEARGPCALAVTDCVPPTVRAAVAGDTCKEVKPGARSETVIVAAVVIVAAANPVPVPAAVTVMVVVPGATAVTMPVAETVATAAVADVYVYTTFTDALALLRAKRRCAILDDGTSYGRLICKIPCRCGTNRYAIVCSSS
jgi:hypothetical protein